MFFLRRFRALAPTRKNDRQVGPADDVIAIEVGITCAAPLCKKHGNVVSVHDAVVIEVARTRHLLEAVARACRGVLFEITDSVTADRAVFGTEDLLIEVTDSIPADDAVLGTEEFFILGTVAITTDGAVFGAGVFRFIEPADAISAG